MHPRNMTRTDYLAGRSMETLEKQFQARFQELKDALKFDILMNRTPNAYTATKADMADRIADELQTREGEHGG